jgi:hypothetical protein
MKAFLNSVLTFVILEHQLPIKGLIVTCQDKSAKSSSLVSDDFLISLNLGLNKIALFEWLIFLWATSFRTIAFGDYAYA